MQDVQIDRLRIKVKKTKSRRTMPLREAGSAFPSDVPTVPFKGTSEALQDGSAMPTEVRYWSTHGWKHGIIVGAIIRPHGRKKAVKVLREDIEGEI